MTRSVKLPAIPAISGVDEKLKSLLLPMKTILDTREGRSGQDLEKVVTKRDLEGIGFDISQTHGGVGSSPPTSTTTGDSEAPGSPTNVSVIFSGISGHRISWTNPSDDDLYYIEIYSATVEGGATAPVFADASVISIVTVNRNIGGQESVERTNINTQLDYYYWLIAVDWSGNPSAVAFVGSLGMGDNPTIDNMIDLLKGEDPAEYDPSTYYVYKDRVSYTSDSKTRRFRRTLYQSGAVNGQTPTGQADDLYWERVGILMEGEIDGADVVGIDGHLVVNNTIHAPAIAGDAFGTLTITSGSINMQTAAGLNILSGGTVNINGGGGNSITMDASGNIDIVGSVTFASGTSGYGNITDAPDLDSVVQTFYQSAAPSGQGEEEGDLWFDTDDNSINRYNGSAWVSIQDDDIAAALADAATAQATADGKIVTFSQASQPTAEGVGDLWIDTDDDNTMYRWSGSAWVSVRDAGIAIAIADAATAQATADGKIETFYQASEPTGATGDLWVDTNDGNKLYRYSGVSWVAVQDDDIAQALADAADAQSTADGKIVSFFQASQPTAEGVGDIWFDTDDDNKPYVWSGSTWDEAGYDVATWAKITGADKPEDNATDNSSWEHSSDTTKIDGGEIYAGSLVSIGDPSNEHVDITGGQIQFNDGGTTIAYIDDTAFRSTKHPAFLAYRSSNLYNVTGGTGSDYTIVCNSEIYDQNSNYNSSTGYFTAPVTGRYLFVVEIYVGGITSACTAIMTYVVTSNRTYQGFDSSVTRKTGAAHVYRVVVADMDANDTAYVSINNAGEASNVHDIIGNATAYPTRFSGFLLC